MQKTENIFALSGMLCVIAAVTALLLAEVHHITAPLIGLSQQQEQLDACRAVLCEAVNFETIEQSAEAVEQIWVGKSDGQTVGYCVATAPMGFGGNIRLLVGIHTNGTVVGVRILSHSETPGLGANIENPTFYEQFGGRCAKNGFTVVTGEPQKESEIAAVSGATISSAAVARGVNTALQTVRQIEEDCIHEK